MKLPKLKIHKLKLKKKKKKKNKSKKKIIISKPKLPKRPERVDGRLTRTKEYMTVIYFAIGSLVLIVILLLNLGLI